MKKLTIIPLLALVIASCGGGNNQTQPQSSDTNTDAAASTASQTSAPSTAKITEDLLKEIWNQLDFHRKADVSLSYSGNSIYYEDFFHLNMCEGEMHVCRIDDSSFKVYFTYLQYSANGDDDSLNDFYVRELTFKDGKLTEDDPQPEFKGYTHGNFFSGDTLQLSNAKSAKRFAWDGKKMVNIMTYDIMAQIAYSGKTMMTTSDLHGKGGEDNNTYKLADYAYFQNKDYDEFFLYCFPNKGDVYNVFFRTYDYQGETIVLDHNKYYYYTYLNGKLQETNNFMPQPGINDFYSNADQFPKEAHDILSAAIAQRDYKYNYQDKTLTISFCPWKEDSRGRVSLPYGIERMLCKQTKDNELYIFPEIKYNWNGTQFVRAPNSKPVEEDVDLLSPFENENGDYGDEDDNNVDQEKLNNFIAALPDHYTDSVYTFHSDGYANPDADFQSADIEYFFPYKSGGYLWFSRHCEGSAGAYFELYGTSVYKNGENKTIKDALPIPDIDDLLIDDQCEKNPELYEGLKKLYNANPADLLRYTYDEYKKVLEVYIYPEDEYDPSWNSDYFDLYNTEFMSFDPYTAKYTWNGERFIKKK